ncbi:MAG: hypothetical protein ACREQN_14080 [Candidatus Binataceae bacterium]
MARLFHKIDSRQVGESMGSANQASAVDYRESTMKSEVEPMRALRLAVAAYEPPTLASSLRIVAHEINFVMLWFCGLITVAVAFAGLWIAVSSTQWVRVAAGTAGLLFFGAAAIAAAYMIIVKWKANAPKDSAVNNSEGEAAVAAD